MHVNVHVCVHNMYMYIIHTCTVHYTFLVVEEAVVPHAHPVVVEGGQGMAGMEHGRMVLEEVLEGLRVARISLRREGRKGGKEEGRKGERERGKGGGGDRKGGRTGKRESRGGRERGKRG